MHPTPMLLDVLIDENQHAIAANAEARRIMADANVVTVPAPFRRTMGSMLISLGERIGGIHRDAIASLAASSDREATRQAERVRLRRAA
ncbi:MAG TPA: hypothetical protein VNP95_03115 [Thermomicrobiales bacterium]|nr:hypothetical protein [Thermomicrobiales bacterium]